MMRYFFKNKYSRLSKGWIKAVRIRENKNKMKFNLSKLDLKKTERRYL